MGEKGDRHAYGASAHELQEGALQIPFISAEDMMRALGLSSSQAIQLIKIDTEGNELQILESLMPFIQSLRIPHLVIEVTPMWWTHTGHTREQGADLFGRLADMGYTARAGNGHLMHGSAIRQHISFFKGEQED